MEAIKLCRLDTPIIFIEVHILSLHDALPISWCCKVETGFIGADALRHVDPRDLLAPFAFTGPGIPRPGNEVHTDHGTGVVTSGTHSPCLEVGIGMAYVPRAAAAAGTAIEVDVRGKRRSAEVRERPLYR